MSLPRCPDDEFWEEAVKKCEPCSQLCHRELQQIKGYDDDDCSRLCPGFYQMTGRHGGEFNPTAIVLQEEEYDKQFSIEPSMFPWIVGIGIMVLLTVFIIVVLVVFLKKARRPASCQVSEEEKRLCDAPAAPMNDTVDTFAPIRQPSAQRALLSSGDSSGRSTLISEETSSGSGRFVPSSGVPSRERKRTFSEDSGVEEAAEGDQLDDECVDDPEGATRQSCDPGCDPGCDHVTLHDSGDPEGATRQSCDPGCDHVTLHDSGDPEGATRQSRHPGCDHVTSHDSQASGEIAKPLQENSSVMDANRDEGVEVSPRAAADDLQLSGYDSGTRFSSNFDHPAPDPMRATISTHSGSHVITVRAPDGAGDAAATVASVQHCIEPRQPATGDQDGTDDVQTHPKLVSGSPDAEEDGVDTVDNLPLLTQQPSDHSVGVAALRTDSVAADSSVHAQPSMASVGSPSLPTPAVSLRGSLPNVYHQPEEDNPFELDLREGSFDDSTGPSLSRGIPQAAYDYLDEQPWVRICMSSGGRMEVMVKQIPSKEAKRLILENTPLEEEDLTVATLLSSHFRYLNGVAEQGVFSITQPVYFLGNPAPDVEETIGIAHDAHVADGDHGLVHDSKSGTSSKTQTEQTSGAPPPIQTTGPETKTMHPPKKRLLFSTIGGFLETKCGTQYIVTSGHNTCVGTKYYYLDGNDDALKEKIENGEEVEEIGTCVYQFWDSESDVAFVKLKPVPRERLNNMFLLPRRERLEQFVPRVTRKNLYKLASCYGGEATYAYKQSPRGLISGKLVHLPLYKTQDEGTKGSEIGMKGSETWAKVSKSRRLFGLDATDWKTGTCSAGDSGASVFSVPTESSGSVDAYGLVAGLLNIKRKFEDGSEILDSVCVFSPLWPAIKRIQEGQRSRGVPVEEYRFVTSTGVKRGQTGVKRGADPRRLRAQYPVSDAGGRGVPQNRGAEQVYGPEHIDAVPTAAEAASVVPLWERPDDRVGEEATPCPTHPAFALEENSSDVTAAESSLQSIHPDIGMPVGTVLTLDNGDEGYYSNLSRPIGPI